MANKIDFSKYKRTKATFESCIYTIIAISIINKFNPLINYGYELLKSTEKKPNYSKEIDQDGKMNTIMKLFKNSINSNKYLSDYEKKCIKESFTPVIKNFGEFFTEKTIVEMVARSTTEKIKLEKNTGNTEAYWKPVENTITTSVPIQEKDRTIIAHEQAHTITTSLSLKKEYKALSEGFTEIVSHSNRYLDEKRIASIIALILGPKKIFNYYFEADYQSIEKEISNYLGEEDTKILLDKMEQNLAIMTDAIEKNTDFTSLRTTYNQNSRIIKEELKKLYHNKYHNLPEEQKEGLKFLIFQSSYFKNNDTRNNLSDSFIKEEYKYYDLYFNSSRTLALTFNDKYNNQEITKKIYLEDIDYYSIDDYLNILKKVSIEFSKYYHQISEVFESSIKGERKSLKSEIVDDNSDMQEFMKEINKLDLGRKEERRLYCLEASSFYKKKARKLSKRLEKRNTKETVKIKVMK